MSTKIVIDSTVDIIEEQRGGVYMVPLTVRFGREEFLDRVTISCEEFYTRLAGCKELPSTSQPRASIRTLNTKINSGMGMCSS